MAKTVLLFDLDDTLLVDDEAMEAALGATAQRATAQYGVEQESLVRSVRRHARELWRAAPTHGYCRSIGISSTEGLWAHFQGDAAPLRDLRAFAPAYRREAWRLALRDHRVDDDRAAEELAEALPVQRRARHWPFPEAESVLQKLLPHYVLALVTNGAPDLQREKIQASGLAEYFAIVTVSGELGIGKPDPRIFYHSLGLLDVAPEEAVMVGNDYGRDVAGARSAGVTAIWINRNGGGAPDRVPADAEVKSLHELLYLLPQEVSAPT